MKTKVINLIKNKMKPILDNNQTVELENVLISILSDFYRFVNAFECFFKSFTTLIVPPELQCPPSPPFAFK